MADEYMLSDRGHYFGGAFDLKHYGSSAATKSISAIWDYTILNLHTYGTTTDTTTVNKTISIQ